VSRFSWELASREQTYLGVVRDQWYYYIDDEWDAPTYTYFRDWLKGLRPGVKKFFLR